MLSPDCSHLVWRQLFLQPMARKATRRANSYSRSPSQRFAERCRDLELVVIHLRIIAFKTGRTWSAWHLSRNAGAPLCGLVIPKEAALCEATRSSGPLLLESLCRRCLTVFANEEPA